MGLVRVRKDLYVNLEAIAIVETKKEHPQVEGPRTYTLVTFVTGRKLKLTPEQAKAIRPYLDSAREP